MGEVGLFAFGGVDQPECCVDQMAVDRNGSCIGWVSDRSPKRSDLIPTKYLLRVLSTPDPDRLVAVDPGGVDFGACTISQDVDDVGNVRVPTVHWAESGVDASDVGRRERQRTWMGGAEVREEATQPMCTRVEGQPITDLLVGCELEGGPDTGARLGVEAVGHADVSCWILNGLSCSGRISFQISSLGSLPSSILNITPGYWHF